MLYIFLLICILYKHLKTLTQDFTCSSFHASRNTKTRSSSPNFNNLPFGQIFEECSLAEEFLGILIKYDILVKGLTLTLCRVDKHLHPHTVSLSVGLHKLAESRAVSGAYLPRQIDSDWK